MLPPPSQAGPPILKVHHKLAINHGNKYPTVEAIYYQYHCVCACQVIASVYVRTVTAHVGCPQGCKTVINSPDLDTDNKSEQISEFKL